MKHLSIVCEEAASRWASKVSGLERLEWNLMGWWRSKRSAVRSARIRGWRSARHGARWASDWSGV